MYAEKRTQIPGASRNEKERGKSKYGEKWDITRTKGACHRENLARAASKHSEDIRRSGKNEQIHKEQVITQGG